LYEIHLQQSVEKELKRMQKRAKTRFQKIQESLGLLQAEPKTESIQLLDQVFHGLRRAKAGEDRILFMICEECRRE
jgi:mRNA-degrading endonuclease RelE of RelBE toxin-antitoxin system